MAAKINGNKTKLCVNTDWLKYFINPEQATTFKTHICNREPGSQWDVTSNFSWNPEAEVQADLKIDGQNKTVRFLVIDTIKMASIGIKTLGLFTYDIPTQCKTIEPNVTSDDEETESNFENLPPTSAANAEEVRMEESDAESDVTITLPITKNNGSDNPDHITGRLRKYIVKTIPYQYPTGFSRKQNRRACKDGKIIPLHNTDDQENTL